jgi:protein-serine/threonine kinase
MTTLATPISDLPSPSPSTADLAYVSSDSPSASIPVQTPSSASSSGTTLSSKIKGVFGRKNKDKGKESAGGESLTSNETVVVPGVRRPFGRSITEPSSYFPPQVSGSSPSPTPSPTTANSIVNGNSNSSTNATPEPTSTSQSNRDLTGLAPLRDIRRNDSIATQNTSGSSASPTASGEQARGHSVSAQTDTDRSSHSSSSRANGHSHLHGSHLAGSTVSVYTTTSSHGGQGISRSPGSALGGFKARFFSNPKEKEKEKPTRDRSPTREVANGGGAVATPSKSDRYNGIGMGISTDSDAEPSRTMGPSDSLSPTDHASPDRGEPSPRTPNKKHLGPPVSPLDKDNKENTPLKGSAATRWLRRVVSAPNTKALLSPNSAAPPVPPVPPIPAPIQTQAQTPSSPTIVITNQDKPGASALHVDLDSPSKTSGMEDGDYGLPPSPTKMRSTPSPHKPPIASSLNPSAGTRGQRAATISSGAKAKDIQAQLGLGHSESHHKQVFRRTYSSNSIKTRSVSLF